MLVDFGKAMCRAHWKLVPGELQLKISRAYTRAFGMGRSPATRQRWRGEHTRALRAAIEVVNARTSRKLL